MTKKCLQCGKEFERYPNAKYCSDRCRNRAMYLLCQEEHTCEICGEKFMTSKYSKSMTCSWACRGQKSSNSAKRLPRMSSGYRMLYCPEHLRSRQDNYSRGYVFEHILVWTEYHKRQVPEGHVIHHIDGNKLNNSIENLELRAKTRHPPGRPACRCKELETFLKIEGLWEGFLTFERTGIVKEPEYAI